MQRNDIANQTNTHRNRAKQIHDLLLEGKIPAQNIPAAIRQADTAYLTITVLIVEWQAQFSLTDFDCEEQIRKATRAFNSFYDPNYKKPLDEIKAMTGIENSVCGGVLCNFRPYLHDKIQYIKRVKSYLDKLNVQLNGHQKQDLISFVKIHSSDSTLVSELRQITSNLKSLSDAAVLDVFETISRKIASANLDELPKPVKSYFALQQKTLAAFNFKQPELNARHAMKLV